jgi:hypothetical protein
MARVAKRRLALTVALLAALGGGGAAALAATGRTQTAGKHAGRAAKHVDSARGHGVMQAASAYLGVPVSQLRSEIRAGKTLAEIAQGTPGKTRAGLVAAIVSAVEQRKGAAIDAAGVDARVEALVDHRRHQPAFGTGAHHNLLPVAGSYLGLSRHELHAKLRSGLTLAEIADATPGKSAAGLRAALIASFEHRLSTVSAAHPLTQQARSNRLQRFERRVARLLARRQTPGPQALARGEETHP